MARIDRWMRHVRNILRFFENRKFRERVRGEKKKKYLIDRGTVSSRSPIAMYSRLREIIKSRKLSRLPSFFASKISSEESRIRFVLSWLGLFLVALSLYILGFSGYFSIAPSRVIIERKDAGSDINIAYKSIEDFYGKSIFLINSQDVRSAIQDLQKNIDTVDISRLYPNGLKIIIASHPNEFVTYVRWMDKYYSVTSNGILIYDRGGKASEFPVLDIVDPELVESNFLDYKAGISTEHMDRILLSKQGMAVLFPDLHIAKYSYFRLENELHIFLESGGRLIISLDGSEERQLKTIEYLNKQEKNILETGGFSYLDVRIPGKIFICREEAVCIRNLSRIYGSYYLK